MKKILSGVIFLLVFTVQFLSAQDFEKSFDIKSVNQNQISVPKTPSVSKVDAAAASYEEYYSALSYYSDKAYKADQGSDEYIEAYLYGNYLRTKVDKAGKKVSKSGDITKGLAPSAEPYVSKNVSAELMNIFGSSNKSVLKGVMEPVVIKDGYCKIVYVKGGTPFLVQFDSFLKKGEVILTFDDGPAPGDYSKQVAGNLKENSARAIFFILGQKMNSRNGDILKTEAADNNFVGVHGYYHATPDGKPFTAYSQDVILKQLQNVSDIIKSDTGSSPEFFRPPYGVIRPDDLNASISKLNLIPVGWSIDSLDWSTKSPDELFDKVVGMIRQRGKGIILLHDIHPQSREVANRLLKWFPENGYKVVSPERLAEAFKSTPQSKK